MTKAQRMDLSARAKAVELTVRGYERYAHGVGELADAIRCLSLVVRELAQAMPVEAAERFPAKKDGVA